MNFKFEKELLLTSLQGKDANFVYEDHLTSLKGMKIAIDATMLLAKAKHHANPQKFIQEGGACLDTQLQARLVKIIHTFKKQWDITLLVVVDGLLPKFVNDKQTNILEKSKNTWELLNLTTQGGSNDQLFMSLLETYGPRCFLTEVMNACLETKTDFFIAPYYSTPQLVHFFKEQMVSCVMGSVMCLLYENINSLTQVVVDFDQEQGFFQFVDKQDILSTFSPNQQLTTIIDLFIAFGSLYGLSVLTEEPSTKSFAEAVGRLSNDEDLDKVLDLKDMNILDFSMLKIIFQIAPVLNNECQLDRLETKSTSSYAGNNFRNVMGLCFNNEIYYQMGKALIHPELLEMVANQSVLSGALIAPSMYIKQIWNEDSDYKFYLEQIFANIHLTHCPPENVSSIPKELRAFYDSNTIDITKILNDNKSEFTLLKWGIDESSIQAEMDRQEMVNEPVSLLFAMKWFYSDLHNKGQQSQLVKGLLDSDPKQEVGMVRSENELMTLCYLSYLETNNYLKSNQKYLFGELVKSTSKTIYQEQVFLFLEMLKVFFPGGDSLVAPTLLQETEKANCLGS